MCRTLALLGDIRISAPGAGDPRAGVVKCEQAGKQEGGVDVIVLVYNVL